MRVRWYPDPLLRWVLALTYVPLVFLAALCVRCVCIPETPWDLRVLHGPGISPHFWVLLGLLVLGAAIVVLGWRGARRWFGALLLVWHAALTAAITGAALSADELELHGEGVGLVISIELLGPLFCLATLGLAVAWVVRDVRHGDPSRTVSPLQRGNRIAAAIAGALLVAALLAYSWGAAQAGLILSVLAALAAYGVARPVNPSEELHKAFVSEGSAPR